MSKITKIIFSKIRNFLKIKPDQNIIPQGNHCYDYDKKRNEMLLDEWDNGFYIKNCPYYLNINENKNCCLYNSKISTDKKFKQKNKICNINKKY